MYSAQVLSKEGGGILVYNAINHTSCSSYSSFGYLKKIPTDMNEDPHCGSDLYFFWLHSFDHFFHS